METLIVGDSNCTINEIIKALSKAPTFALLDTKWYDLATYLNVSIVESKRLRRQFEGNYITLSEVISEIIISWKSRRAEKATLVELIKILKTDCQLGDMADKLRDAFQSQLPHCSNHSTKIFLSPPEYLSKFVSSADMVLIVQSINPQLTCNKIQETYSKSRIYNLNEFLTTLSKPQQSGEFSESLTVVNCENNVEFLELYENESKDKTLFVIANFDVDKYHFDNPVVQDEFSFADLFPVYKFRVIEKCKLLTGLNTTKRRDLLSSVDQKVLIQLIKGESPSILRDTIPEQIKYYVTRRLTTRNTLNTQILSMECPDIFMIRGIERLELSDLSNGRCTETSSNLLASGGNTNIRLIVLEQGAHFDIIAKRSVKIPVHLLHYKDDKLIWIKSTAGINNIQNHLSTEQLTLPEDYFLSVSQSTKKSTIIISDSPGMGKSMLLAEIARKLQNCEKQISVYYIVFKELMVEIKKNSDSDSIVNAVSKCVCLNKLGELHFEKSKGDVTHIFIDGFDEIGLEEVELGYDILKQITKIFENAKLWVTTRPHMLTELEVVLNVMGHNIEPFDQSDQVKFLVSFWSESANLSLESDKLKQFSLQCLRAIKVRIESGRDNDIAGIPLQCLLIGEVFMTEVISYCDTKHAVMPAIIINSICDLYEKLVTKKFSLFHERHKQEDISNLDLLLVHTYLSLSLLFPACLIKNHIYFKNTSVNVQAVLKVGILEKQMNDITPRFIHRTFAEYIVAKFIVEVILSKKVSPISFDFLFKDVFQSVKSMIQINTVYVPTRQFKFEVICYFVDTLLGNDLENSNIGNNFLSSYKSFRCQLVSEVCEAAAFHNFKNIFMFIVKKLPFYDEISKKVFNHKFLVLWTLRSDAAFVNNVYNEYKYITKSSLDNIFIQDKYTLLHFAVARGEYSIVELLVNSGGFKAHINNAVSCLEQDYLYENSAYLNIIHTCVINSKSQNQKTIAQKRDIIKYFFFISKHLLTHKSKIVDFPFMSSQIHPELVFHIIQLTGNFFDETSISQLLHKLTVTFTSKEYLSLLQHIAKTYPGNFVMSVLNSKTLRLTLIQRILRKMNPDAELLHFLAEHGRVFDMNSENKLSLLYTAIESIKNLNSLKWLLNNLKISSAELEKLFWHSHDCGNIKLLNILIKEKYIDANLKDVYGNNSLHRICKEHRQVTCKEYEYINVLVATHNELALKVNKLGKSPLDSLLLTRPSKFGYITLDLLSKEPCIMEKAFMKWTWLVKNCKVDEFTFKELALICFSEIGHLSMTDKNENSALHIAAKYNNKTAIHHICLGIDSEFLSEKQKLERNIFAACMSRDLGLVQNACDEYEIQTKCLPKDIDCPFMGKRATLLDRGLLSHDGYILEYVLEVQNCEMDVQNIHLPFGNNWIHKTAYHGEYQNVEKYISIVCKIYPDLVNAENKDGLVPLSVTNFAGNPLHILISYGANINATDKHGNTPLHWALKRGEQSIQGFVCYEIGELIRKGADVNTVNDDGDTVLKLVLKLSDKWSVGRCLMVLVDDPNFKVMEKNEFGDTFLHRIPAEMGNYNFRGIVEALIKRGSLEIFDCIGRNDRTPLQIANQYLLIDETTKKLLEDNGLPREGFQ